MRDLRRLFIHGPIAIQRPRVVQRGGLNEIFVHLGGMKGVKDHRGKRDAVGFRNDCSRFLS